MKVVAKKSFATRLKGYVAGVIYEVSEEDYKGFANLVEPVKDTKNEEKQGEKEEKINKKSTKKAK